MPRAFIAIRIDEPMVYRVVVTALQIIEPRLSVVIVASKADLLAYSTTNRLVLVEQAAKRSDVRIDDNLN